MKAPDKIYISRPIYNQCGLVISEDKPVEYIRKDLLLEWAKDNYLNLRNRSVADGIKASAFEEIINKINSL